MQEHPSHTAASAGGDRAPDTRDSRRHIFALPFTARPIRRPGLTFAVARRTVPTHDREQGPTDPEIARAVTMPDRYAAQLGFTGIAMHDPRQGIIM